MLIFQMQKVLLVIQRISGIYRMDIDKLDTILVLILGIDKL